MDQICQYFLALISLFPLCKFLYRLYFSIYVYIIPFPLLLFQRFSVSAVWHQSSSYKSSGLFSLEKKGMARNPLDSSGRMSKRESEGFQQEESWCPSLQRLTLHCQEDQDGSGMWWMQHTRLSHIVPPLQTIRLPYAFCIQTPSSKL